MKPKYFDLESMPIDRFAKIHAAFSDQKRIELMLSLYPREEMSEIKLRNELGISRTESDYHLKLLKKYGFLESSEGRVGGARTRYRLTDYARKVIEAFRYKSVEKKK